MASPFAFVSRLLGLFLWPALVLAQNITVTVNAGTAVRTVDERVFGLNATLWDPEVANAQTISLLQAAGVRAIRLPGGSLSDEYHWRTNTSLAHTWTWASGFNKFADLITKQVGSLRGQGSSEVAFRVALKDGKVAFTARAMKDGKTVD